MKKKVISGIFALALLATAGWGVQKSMSNNANLNELALANVEALAQSENDIDDLFTNCTWQEYSSCLYIIVTPNGSTGWQHWNMRNYY